MKGYFARKPENIEIVKDSIALAIRCKFKPVEIKEIGKVILTLDEYIQLCGSLSREWDFLKPYAEDSSFEGEHEARCVLVGAPGQHYIAVCLEGYSYPRYVAWPFTDEELGWMKKEAFSAEERHIRSLEINGALIRKPDGSTEPVNVEFYKKAVARCSRIGCNAIAYDLCLPGLDGAFQIAIWRDGHVDSGSAARIADCLNR